VLSTRDDDVTKSVCPSAQLVHVDRHPSHTKDNKRKTARSKTTDSQIPAHPRAEGVEEGRGGKARRRRGVPKDRYLSFREDEGGLPIYLLSIYKRLGNWRGSSRLAFGV